MLKEASVIDLTILQIGKKVETLCLLDLGMAGNGWRYLCVVFVRQKGMAGNGWRYLCVVFVRQKGMAGNG
jgi:hypothetical protein